MDVLLRLEPWAAALVFAGLMLIGWWAGSRVRARGAPGSAPGAPSSRIDDASLALFGLLLAFSFSGAAARYDARKSVLVEEAVAIGDLWGATSMLEEPHRSELHHELVGYVEGRVRFGTTSLDDPAMAGLIRDARASHGRMAAITRRAIAAGNTPSVHTPLVNTLNATTSAHDRRLFAVRQQSPGSIVDLLVVFGVFTTFTMGRRGDDLEASTSAVVLRRGAYVLLVALVFGITMDLDAPRRGLVRVPQTSMQELLDTLTAPDESRRAAPHGPLGSTMVPGGSGSAHPLQFGPPGSSSAQKPPMQASVSSQHSAALSHASPSWAQPPLPSLHTLVPSGCCVQ